jgi:alcohol dehydrogenase class IV
MLVDEGRLSPETRITEVLPGALLHGLFVIDGRDYCKQVTIAHLLSHTAEIADYLGLGGKSEDEKVERLIKKIEELKRICEIPENLDAFGLDRGEFEEQVDQMALEAFDDQCTSANPRYPLVEELKQLYLDAFERNC